MHCSIIIVTTSMSQIKLSICQHLQLKMRIFYKRNIHLVLWSEMFQRSKWGYSKALFITHPHLYEVEVVTALCQQWESTWLNVTPVASDKRMSKVPVANLHWHIYNNAWYCHI